MSADKSQKKRGGRMPSGAGTDGDVPQKTAAQDDALLCVARIGRAFGVRGGVHLTLFADDPDLLLREDGVLDEKGNFLFRVDTLHWRKQDDYTAEIEGITDRDAAEALKGKKLYLPRAVLPVIEEEDSFYYVDLIGIPVFAETGGAEIGEIVSVQNFGAGDLLEIRKSETLSARGGSFYLPFTKECVPVVDMTARRVVVHLPEGYLDEEKKPS
jgi:16S rRNA processing protein RimM